MVHLCIHSMSSVRLLVASTDLLSRSRAVVDKHKGGEDIGGQADDGDEVRCDPGRYSGHQPLPVTLHQGLQQRATGAAVPAQSTLSHPPALPSSR